MLNRKIVLLCNLMIFSGKISFAMQFTSVNKNNRLFCSRKQAVDYRSLPIYKAAAKR